MYLVFKKGMEKLECVYRRKNSEERGGKYGYWGKVNNDGYSFFLFRKEG